MEISKALFDFNFLLDDKKVIISDWAEKKRNDKDWPIYHSFDLRISANKVCHVDSNLFPAGFNNVSDVSADLAKKYFENRLLKSNKILLIVENLSRNISYMKNIAKLCSILSDNNREIKIGLIDIDKNQLIKIGNDEFWFYKVYNDNGDVIIKNDIGNWRPELIVLNDDLTIGIPEELKIINKKIMPDPNDGWHTRRKSDHFRKYNELVIELSEIIDFDPYLISARFEVVNGVNFRDKIGFVSLYDSAVNLFNRVISDNEIRGIDEPLYAFLKSNRGTFGMGIMEIKDPAEILTINKKKRHSMGLIKYGISNSEIFIQEGIKTIQDFEGKSAETVVYSVDSQIIGAMHRYNDEKDCYDNLNSKGMRFSQIVPMTGSELYFNIIWLINKLANLSCIV
jgi:glutamate--cysteine ligase